MLTEPEPQLSDTAVATPSPARGRTAPAAVDVPESFQYRMKRKLLGPPLTNDQLEHERLGKPTALAVFASDNLSSSAYATEEILRVLLPGIGIAAFALVVPITVAMLGVLALLILSYRQTIKEYPTAGGAYIVTKDNFGLLPAQVAGVALLTDYILTVSVSVAAGTAALTSVFHVLTPYAVPISLLFIAVIAFGNLRGVKESGKVFAVPTYFFIGNMVLLLLVGMYKLVTGTLPQAEYSSSAQLVHFGSSPDAGLMTFAGIYLVMHAFASGGAAVTGVEAISNGVPAFKKPEWKNARQTLVVMGSLLGAMFLGLSVLAAHLQVAPYESGTPTVIAQVGRLTFGDTPLGTVLFVSLQAATMLILVLAANTSFADFPRLASFHADDAFMPKQLTKRGHRLVFSNGIIALAIAAAVLVVITGAKVDRLIPLYAIGVFTSFTLSQGGMARHHLRKKEQGWRTGFIINFSGSVISGVVTIIIAVTKFTHGAWVICILVPVMVALLVRLNRQYESESFELEHEARAAATAPILRRHVVLVPIDRLDNSAARALQYGRTLMPDEIRAVHAAVDSRAAKALAEQWSRLGLERIPLEIVDCSDRRITRRLVEVVADELADGNTEVSLLIPQVRYRRFWHNWLHDSTSTSISDAVAQLPHANVTFVPYHLGTRRPHEEVQA